MYALAKVNTSCITTSIHLCQSSFALNKRLLLVTTRSLAHEECSGTSKYCKENDNSDNSTATHSTLRGGLIIVEESSVVPVVGSVGLVLAVLALLVIVFGVGSSDHAGVNGASSTHVIDLFLGELKAVPVVVADVVISRLIIVFFGGFIATAVVKINGSVFLDKLLAPFGSFRFFFIFLLFFLFLFSVLGLLHLFIVVIDFVVPNDFRVVAFDSVIGKSELNNVRDHVVVRLVSILHDVGKGEFRSIQSTIFIQEKTNFKTSSLGITHKARVNLVIVHKGVGLSTFRESVQPFHGVVELSFNVFSIFIVVSVGGLFVEIKTFVVSTHLAVNEFKNLVVGELSALQLARFLGQAALFIISFSFFTIFFSFSFLALVFSFFSFFFLSFLALVFSGFFFLLLFFRFITFRIVLSTCRLGVAVIVVFFAGLAVLLNLVW
mmetsp:Transcript_6207/g.15396  ORF Transcript_6207/g.15396 Transcript_6207/m.15396 type:complete len:435 (+) Transcript_6207:200-1504(+)